MLAALSLTGLSTEYLAGDERGARPTRMRGARSVECVDPEGTPLVNGVDHVVLKFYPDVLGLVAHESRAISSGGRQAT